MMPLKSPPNLRPPLHDSTQTEPRFDSSSPRLRLAESSARALEARLEHALRMLDVRSAPLVSMLRFRTIPGPSVDRQTNCGQRWRP